MSSSFGQEMLGRIVQDKKGKELGKLTDLVVDISNGEISELLIKCSEHIDANRLPFPIKDGAVAIPSTEVSSFGNVILLKI
ncbi:MAG: PRC-barrel domain-containing protein [Candidatus Poseidoniaceae archaeon]|jgi:sporulation protein YlmC with PRC-barrel domain|nr:PRC-barrel domain-containing protein [Candidatus Poseidoniaceae archaeon]